jgi:hypothetical protein
MIADMSDKNLIERIFKAGKIEPAKTMKEE